MGGASRVGEKMIGTLTLTGIDRLDAVVGSVASFLMSNDSFNDGTF